MHQLVLREFSMILNASSGLLVFNFRIDALHSIDNIFQYKTNPQTNKGQISDGGMCIVHYALSNYATYG